MGFYAKMKHRPHNYKQILAYCQQNKTGHKFKDVKQWWPNRPDPEEKPAEKAVNADEYNKDPNAVNDDASDNDEDDSENENDDQKEAQNDDDDEEEPGKNNDDDGDKPEEEDKPNDDEEDDGDDDDEED